MVLLVPFLIGTQMLCSLAGYLPLPREAPPHPPAKILPANCSSPSVKTAAELALDKLNKDRKTGYVFGLQRIFDVQELQWQETGNVYYLTLDVLETRCHVLSRKTWKDCEFRLPHESVYGQCKATFYINRPWRILHLFNYDCVLQPLPASVIVRMCPDCPTPSDPTESKYQEAAALSLDKFNTESNHIHHFKLVNVTRASSQWVIGPSNFVEYVIRETNCSKVRPVENISNCEFLSDEKADVGVCNGSMVNSMIEHQMFISAHCELFHPQPQVHGRQPTGNKKPGHQDDHEKHEDDHHSEGGRQNGGHTEGGRQDGGHSEGGRKGHHDGHSECRRKGHHDGHSGGRREGHHDGHSGGRREGHHGGRSEGRREGHHDGHSEDRRKGRHGGRSEGRREGHHDGHSEDRGEGHHGGHSEGRKGGHHDHPKHGQNPPTSDNCDISTHLEKTVGHVVVLPISNPHVSLHSLPDIEAERLDGVPIPPQSETPKLGPTQSETHGVPDTSRPLDDPTAHPTLTDPAQPVTPPPFPQWFSQSDSCPGEIKVSVLGLDTLLPKRPLELSPTAPGSQDKSKVKNCEGQCPVIALQVYKEIEIHLKSLLFLAGSKLPPVSPAISRMVLLVSILIGTQILCSLADSPPIHQLPSRPRPLLPRPPLPPKHYPPPPPERWISPGCNSSSIKAVADLALDKMNKHRKTGYVLGLQRIFDARQLQWQGTGFVYYLILDVLETKCHILSEKSWKDCQFRHAHETVYGQCKAIIYINKPRRIVHLFNYDCALRTIPPRVITQSCPDCPTPGDPTQPHYVEAAKKSLAKFNKESNHTHYFNVHDVTKAQMQWVVGPAYFVEYITRETNCSKSQAAADLSQCQFLPDGIADVGVCRGSVVNNRFELEEHISVTCDIFHPQVDEGHRPGKREPGNQDGAESHEGDGHAASEQNRNHSRHQHHHREHHHGHHSHDHAEHEETPHTDGVFELTTPLEKTVGQVKVLPPIHLDQSPSIERGLSESVPVLPESTQPAPVPNLPDIHGAPEGSRPLDEPGWTRPVRPMAPPPFPDGFSESDSCPGEMEVTIFYLDSLLPRKPAKPHQVPT
ncbi:uncharacterized protein LOC143842761 [Paroedura picta]|uniref:uncharacterized protein LOC143842761 n=1 Tax=Paroedura picta TaxID=143630 RepID=UPI004055FC67